MTNFDFELLLLRRAEGMGGEGGGGAMGSCFACLFGATRAGCFDEGIAVWWLIVSCFVGAMRADC